MVVHVLAKHEMRVRFSYPAHFFATFGHLEMLRYFNQSEEVLFVTLVKKNIALLDLNPQILEYSLVA